MKTEDCGWQSSLTHGCKQIQVFFFLFVKIYFLKSAGYLGDKIMSRMRTIWLAAKFSAGLWVWLCKRQKPHEQHVRNLQWGKKKCRRNRLCEGWILRHKYCSVAVTGKANSNLAHVSASRIKLKEAVKNIETNKNYRPKWQHVWSECVTYFCFFKLNMYLMHSLMLRVSAWWRNAFQSTGRWSIVKKEKANYL